MRQARGTRHGVMGLILIFFFSVLPLAAGLAPLAYGQETVVVRAKLIQGEVPTDPAAPIWSTIAATEFPMSPQVHWQCICGFHPESPTALRFFLPGISPTAWTGPAASTTGT